MYKLNVFTGTFDITNRPGSGGGGVERVGATTSKSIPRWVGSSQDFIDGSLATIQDSGAVNAQGFITDREVSGTIVVGDTETWIAPSLEMQPGSVIKLGAGGQLIIV